MPQLLRIDASADPAGSHSRALTQAFTNVWAQRGPDHTVLTRDLHCSPPPHLPHFALHWPHADGDGGTAAARAVQDELIAEVLSADVIVIGVPLYNFSMPSTLKAWVDHLHVPGITTAADDETQGRVADLDPVRASAELDQARAAASELAATL